MSSAQEFSPVIIRSRQVRYRSAGVAPMPSRPVLLTRCRVIDLMRIGRTLCC
ncbi:MULTISPECIES: hypothetical protein [Streptomyces]|uniref:hypothetical protein n=1 Tax=Streptomyces TaxID=1883 RepID=UPI0014221ABE|nr:MULTISPECIES: hypothetical protein [Streptomyces]